MFPPDADPADVVAEARLAEELGFDFLACGEHLFFHVPTTNAFIALAAAAGATDRIRLVSALTVLPLYPAVLAAKLATTLDRVSRGRFELGVGVGGEFPAEFDAVGVPVRERGRRTDESLRVFRELETGEPVSFTGEFTSLDGLAMLPRPVHRPRIPVWIGGRSDAALRRAARFGDVWLPYMITPDKMAAAVPRLRAETAAQGRPSDAVRAGVFCWSGVADDPAHARQTAVDHVSRLYQQDFEDLAERYLLTGDPARVLARLGEYAAAGTTEVVFAPACGPAERPAMVRRFAAEVLPVAQGWSSPAAATRSTENGSP